MIKVPTPKIATPEGPVFGILRAIRTEGKPPAGGPSCSTGMSLMDCWQIHQQQMSVLYCTNTCRHKEFHYNDVELEAPLWFELRLGAPGKVREGEIP
eukprot:scaffold423420_cov53-Prasinocladus_malaysianus.AAC.3